MNQAVDEVDNFRSELQQRLEINPEDINALIHLGVLEFEHFHKSELALSLLEKAVQMDPLNVDAKFWLGMSLLFDYFEYEQAESLWKEALLIDPKRADCLSMIAWSITANKGSSHEAIKYAQQALSFAPHWPMIRCQLAELFLKLGQIERAEEEVKKAIDIPAIDDKEIVDEVQRYYECVVTGRLKDEKIGYRYLLANIKEAKDKAKKEYS